MRSRLALLVLLLGMAAGAPAQVVRIIWIGQSGFLIQSEGGPTVFADPPAANLGYPLPQTPADVVTVTHNHGDHNNTAGVRGNFTLVDGRPITARTEMTAANLPFVLIPGFHDNQNGSARGPNALMRWTQSGLRFAHFGDIGQDELTPAQLADLQDLDVLFLPAGGGPTIDTQRAAAYVNQLRPRVAVLMHYRTALGGPATLAALPAAATPFGAVVYKPPSVVLSRDRLPAAREVWVMLPAADSAVVNAGGFEEGVPVAPGSLASLFGTFTGSGTFAASQVPLARRLGETEVLLQGNPAPLLFVSPDQINLQVPTALAAGQYLVEARVAGRVLSRAALTVVPRAPGLFVVVNQDGRLNSASNPARRNEVVQIYATGQGEVSVPVEDGAPPPSGLLAVTPVRPDVTVGGRPATVRFSGLAPGFVGLWQLNATLPSDAPTGVAVPLVITHGLATRPFSVAIQ